MENPISISLLNDFIFCPVSIYFHNLYEGVDNALYQCPDQINGTYAHKTIDENRYSTKKSVLQGIKVYSEKYNLIGMIDVFDSQTGVLTERKKKITNIYDGYIFQVYAQYFCLQEMGYSVTKIMLHSLDDNKNYNIKLPTDDVSMFQKFERTILELNQFDANCFIQTNPLKCDRCIYESYCDRSV